MLHPGGRGVVVIMDMEGMRSAVEQASQGLAHPAHRAAAESTLMEFRRSPHALGACRHILEQSTVTEAAFQAAATLRDAALRDWAALPPAERSGLRQFCLHLVLVKSPPPPPVVVSQIISTLAVLLKRAWLDAGADRGGMLSEAENAVSQASTAGARRTGLLLFAGVITEFSPTTASPMNLPWDFHERCRASLEKDFLQHFFAHGAGIARAAAEGGGALGGTDDGVCVAALRLMSTALAWDFARGGNDQLTAGGGGFGYVPDSHRSGADGGDNGAIDAVKIAPGPGWRNVLLVPGCNDWLFALHAEASRRCHAAANDAAANAVACAARAVVVSLCSLSGGVFVPAAEDPTASTRRRHFVQCAGALAQTLLPARNALALAAQGVGEEALVDCVRGLAALATIHPAGDFLLPLEAGAAEAVVSNPGGGDVTALSMIGELTMECLHAGVLSTAAEGSAGEEVLWMLMEAWGSLLANAVWQSPAAGPEATTPPELVAGAAQVFQAYLQAGLAAAAEAAFEEDDGQEEEGKAGAAALDERLALAAVLARAAPDATMPLLKAAAEAKKQALSAAVSTGADPTVPLEELWWLGRLIPHVLADAFEGEIPLPPDALAECTGKATREGVESPVDALSTEFISLTCLCLDEGARRALSPRLMETLAWGTARWVDTYLMPEDTGGSLHAAIFAGQALGLRGDEGGEGRVYRGANKTRPAAFSEAGGGGRALDALLRVAYTALTAWPGEGALQRTVASVLLPALTRRRALCRACVSLPMWAQIIDLEASALARAVDPNGPAGGASFPPEIHRGVCVVLGRAAEGLNDEAQCREYIGRILSPLGTALQTVAGDPAAIAHPFGEARAVAVLEALRGAVQATIARSQAPVFDFFVTSFEPLLVLQSAGQNSAQISRLVLRLTEEIVKNQSCFLCPAHAAIMCRHCLRVVEVYAQSSRCKVGMEVGATHRSERIKESYKEVKALLRMLTHVTDSDAGGDEDDDGGGGGGPTVAAAAAMAAGQGAMEGRLKGGRAVGGANEMAAVDVAQVVFIGLNTVIPLITDELLTFPKLCHQYFTLLGHMLEAYPGKVAALPRELFSALMGTLEFGLKHSNVEVARESLAALAAMGQFHHCAEANAAAVAANPQAGDLAALIGPVGLGQHNAPAAERGGVSILAHLMRVVLNRLIFEDASMDLVEAAADALLPLMMCERGAFERTAQELLAGLSGNAGAQQHVAGSLHALTTANGLTDKVDRANRRRFRRNMSKFLMETRGFVRHT